MKSKVLVMLMIFSMSAMIFLTVSCSYNQGNSLLGAANVLKKVPSDAVAVAVVDVGQLMNKIDYNNFKKTEIFKGMLRRSESDLIKEILENPEKSGIATNGQFCMYADVKDSESFLLGTLLPIKNKKDLETLFDKLGKENSSLNKVEDKKDFKYIFSDEGDQKFGIGWNDKMLAIIMSPNNNPVDVISDIFDTKRKESILTNKNFKTDKAERHDMMLWIQSDPLVKMVKADKKMSRSLKQIGFLGLKETSLDGNTIALFYDFNKGEMESGISYNMNEEIEKEYGMIFKNKIGTDFSPYFPKKNLIGVTFLGLDLKGVQQVLKNRGVEGFINMYLGENGLSLEDIVKGIKGELAFATYVNPNATDALNAQKMTVAIAFEKADFLEKLVDASGELGLGKIKKSGTRYMSAISDEVQGVMVKNVFIISNDAAVLDKIEKGGFSGNDAIDKKYIADMKKGWLSGHVDYSQFLKSAEDLPIGGFGAPDMSKLFKILNQYNELEATIAVMNTESASLKVSLKNKKDNSLKVLSEIADKVYLDRDKIQREFENVLESTEDDEEI